jgi:hypothetical protein
VSGQQGTGALCLLGQGLQAHRGSLRRFRQVWGSVPAMGQNPPQRCAPEPAVGAPPDHLGNGGGRVPGYRQDQGLGAVQRLRGELSGREQADRQPVATQPGTDGGGDGALAADRGGWAKKAMGVGGPFHVQHHGPCVPASPRAVRAEAKSPARVTSMARASRPRGQ